MQHWTMDDIPWASFDPAKVDPQFLPLAKAASLVEYNGSVYGRYLSEVFSDDPEFSKLAKQWADEEVQHGEALARWAALADPSFDFKASFQRFITGYQQVPDQVNGSVRGSRASELVARCIVETGTSNYYTAIKENCDEPVLKAIAAKIAADEFRHYKLFYDALQQYRKSENLSLWRRLKVALTRVAETDDDELAYAYYAANVSPSEPYDRKRYSRLYALGAYPLYQRRHVDMMAAMIFKTIGLKPHTRLFRAISDLAWRFVQRRALQAAA